MKSKSKKKSAISLIVLVVTILILGILAAVVVISLSSGGIIGQAQNAVDKNNEAVNKEKSLFEKIEDLLNGNTGEDSEIAALIGTVVTENTEVTDEYGNKIVVPEGFKIVAHNNDTVKYTYSDSENNIPTVQDGIVIEDATGGANNGTRFVWVPVGEIKNKDNTTTTISLENATIEASTFNADESTVIQKTAYEYSMFNGTDVKFEKVGTNDISTRIQYLQEMIDVLNDRLTVYFNNLSAEETILDTLEQIEYDRDLDTFLATTKEKGGYYIAQSQIKTEDTIEYQPDASKVAKEMYGEVKDKDSNLIYASDLINEYALCAAHIFFDSYSNSENDIKCNISQIQGFIIDYSYPSSEESALKSFSSDNRLVENAKHRYSVYDDTNLELILLVSSDSLTTKIQSLQGQVDDLETIWSELLVYCGRLYDRTCALRDWLRTICEKAENGKSYIGKISNKTELSFELRDKTKFEKTAVADSTSTELEYIRVQLDDLDSRIGAFWGAYTEDAVREFEYVGGLGIRPILYVK